MGGHGGDDIFIIFMIKWGDVFFHENSIFMKKWTGDDFRLMTRVLPRPLVLQGGKSFEKQQQYLKDNKHHIDI